ncbi:unnamed protein product [Auanema sp. JU1783]|nr:unnamed protein product [Auanema sp. JU1783]
MTELNSSLQQLTWLLLTHSQPTTSSNQIPLHSNYESHRTENKKFHEVSNQSASRQIPKNSTRVRFKDPNKPVLSYTQLIYQAVMASPRKRCTLSEIYSYITSNFDYYRNTKNSSWKNSIRHNLSVSRIFRKMDKVQGEKSFTWVLDNDHVELHKNPKLFQSQTRINPIIKRMFKIDTDETEEVSAQIVSSSTNNASQSPSPSLPPSSTPNSLQRFSSSPNVWSPSSSNSSTCSVSSCTSKPSACPVSSVQTVSNSAMRTSSITQAYQQPMKVDDTALKKFSQKISNLDDDEEEEDISGLSLFASQDLTASFKKVYEDLFSNERDNLNKNRNFAKIALEAAGVSLAHAQNLGKSGSFHNIQSLIHTTSHTNQTSSSKAARHDVNSTILPANAVSTTNADADIIIDVSAPNLNEEEIVNVEDDSEDDFDWSRIT